MEKCKCYDIKQVNHDPEPYYDDNFQLRYKYRYVENVAVCNGTKECDPCSCGGDPRKCNFYEDIRKEASKMSTLEMMNEAYKSSKTYISNKEDMKSMRFNSKLGFHNYEGTPWEGYAFAHLNSLLLIDTWSELPNNIMTKSEAEAKFNIKIVG